jgi:UDP-2,3-diacylglucosamine pyrophosphatase LpxH
VITTEELKQAVAEYGSLSAAARHLTAIGKPISRYAIRRRLAKIKPAPHELPFTVSQPPPVMDVQALVEERKRKFQMLKEHNDQSRVTRVKVNIDGPIGIGWMGDPHVDDDGTDIDLLFRHAELFDGRVEGLFGACIGDVWNNWVGRLARLWAEQSTSASEARALMTEYLNMVDWLIFIAGNHDMWQNYDILEHLLNNSAAVARPTRARVILEFPNVREVKIYASHDFKGRSQWSPSFGPAKKAQLHQWADIYIAGHIHDAAYQHGFHPDGRMWHAVRMASYKKVDEYVEQLDLEPSPGYECPVCIIDPHATSDLNLIRWEWDPFEAAQRLKWMRGKWRSGTKVKPKGR